MFNLLCEKNVLSIYITYHTILSVSHTYILLSASFTIHGLRILSKGDVLQYNQLKDAIPKEWRTKLKTMKVSKNTIQRDENLYIHINKQILPTNLITNKEVYWKIVKNKQLPHVTKVKWEQELNIHPDSWSYIFQNSLLIRDTKIRSFQYKLRCLATAGVKKIYP
jgi:hypothetical protein